MSEWDEYRWTITEAAPLWRGTHRNMRAKIYRWIRDEVFLPHEHHGCRLTIEDLVAVEILHLLFSWGVTAADVLRFYQSRPGLASHAGRTFQALIAQGAPPLVVTQARGRKIIQLRSRSMPLTPSVLWIDCKGLEIDTKFRATNVGLCNPKERK